MSKRVAFFGQIFVLYIDSMIVIYSNIQQYKGKQMPGLFPLMPADGSMAWLRPSDP